MLYSSRKIIDGVCSFMNNPAFWDMIQKKYIFAPEEETWLRYDERHIIWGPSWRLLVVPINGYKRQWDDVEVDDNMCITDDSIGSLGRATLDVDVPKSNWKRLVHEDRDGPSRRLRMATRTAMNVKETTLKQTPLCVPLTIWLVCWGGQRWMQSL